MTISLSCFCEFVRAKSSAARDAVIRRYKQSGSGEAKGRISYYGPAKRALTGRLCPGGSVEEKLAAIKKESYRPSWTSKLNDARIANNIRVFHAVRSVFGNNDLVALSNPRMQFLASTDLAINLQPNLCFEHEGKLTMVILGLKKRSWPEPIIRSILQMFFQGTRHKGISIPIQRILFLETGITRIFSEAQEDCHLVDGLRVLGSDLLTSWNAN